MKDLKCNAGFVAWAEKKAEERRAYPANIMEGKMRISRKND